MGVRFNFNAAPTLKDIEEELLAYEELYGTPPDYTFVDVLMQVNYAEDSEHASHARIMAYLKYLARSRRTAVVVVHHASEGKPEGRHPICPPLSAALQKVNQLPALILSVAHDQSNFYIAPVKNRGGADDRTGWTYLTFKWQPEYGRVAE